MNGFFIKKKDEGIHLFRNQYDARFHDKIASVFTSANGYFGIRAMGGLPTLSGNRGMFVAGLYNRAFASEVAELVNCPDLAAFSVTLSSENTVDRAIYLSPDTVSLLRYEVDCDLGSGEVMFLYDFAVSETEQLFIKERRFASFADPHLFCQEIRFENRGSGSVFLHLESGIDGRQTNSGVSHFSDMVFRVRDKKFMQLEASLDSASLRMIKGSPAPSSDFSLLRRQIKGSYSFHLRPGEENSIFFCSYLEKGLSKYSGDNRANHSTECPAKNPSKYSGGDFSENRELHTIFQKLDACLTCGYEECLKNHRETVRLKSESSLISIEGATLKEEAALAFSRYHLLRMMPYYSPEASIGAKGLTGEGYRGHVFWDTEIFILPFFILHYPQEAGKLLKYRFQGIEKAKEKAVEYGYKGAMYPWEATVGGKEETPRYAALNIHTGKAQEVWSGIKEHHVSADIAYAIMQYYYMSGDDAFMRDFGDEMLTAIADFWVSRTRWSNSLNKLVILDVIGPDEYTEHVDNNAYTNYMAAFSVEAALKQLRKQANMEAEEKCRLYEAFLKNIYLPQPNEDGIIPQDDTFLTKPELSDSEMDKYRNSPVKQSILKVYSRDEVVDRQVLKQADLVMLFNLLPRIFPEELVKKNTLFYEKRTIHDSSLSYCAHAQAMAAIGETEHGIEFFRHAMEIDLNDNPLDTRDGIHSASIGGIYTSILFGFGGIGVEEEALRIYPRLPMHWKKMSFSLLYKGHRLRIEITKDTLCVLTSDLKGKEPSLLIDYEGRRYELKEGRLFCRR